MKYLSTKREKTMIPNYYDLFDLEKYDDLQLSDDIVFRKLTENANAKKSINNHISKYETGYYILSNNHIKAKYDYILKYGWLTIISNPLKLIYVIYIIGIVRLRSYLSCCKE